MASPGGVEVARVSVRVLPDTSRMLAELEADLKKIEAQTELRVNATIDSARLDEEARRAVSQAELAAGNIHIDAEVDTSQIREAEIALSDATSSAQGFSGGLSGITTAVILLGPALVPVTAAVIALGAALVAPIAIAGGGLTVFGILAGFTVSETNKQLKVIKQLDAKLSTLTKGTQAYADTAAQLRNAQAALTPAQAAYAAALDRVKRSFDSIPKAIVLKPITDGLALLAHLLPLVEPILRVVSNVISDVIGQFDKAARSAGFKTFVDAFANQLGPDLRAFATIAGNVFKGLFGLFAAFNAQLSGSVLSSLENLTAKFATWGQTVGQSKGFKSFVDYVKRVGPQVAKALGDITGALVNIVKAAAPIGTVVLAAIDGLAQAIGKIPTKTLTGLLAAFAGLAIASKVAGPVQALMTALATQPELVLVVAAVAALAAGFVLLYQKSKPLQSLVADLGDFFKTRLLPVIKQAAQQIIPSLTAAFRDMSRSIKENRPFLEVMGKLLLVFTSAAVVAGIVAIAAAFRVMGRVIAAQIQSWHLFADVVLVVLRKLVGSFTLFAQGVLSVFGTIVDGAASAFGWLPGIGGKVKAAQAAFHTFADGVVTDLKRTSDKLQQIQDQIDGKHVLHITVDDLKAVKQLEALQAFRLKDKTLTIQVRQELERAVGPGGGMGRPTGSGDGSAGRPGPLVNIDKAYISDTNDLLRKADDRVRARAGGGVNLRPGPTPVLGG